jgi:hypothetical protein
MSTGGEILKATIFVEYAGKQVEDKAIIAHAKQLWVESGHKVGDLKTLELYIKPEDNSVYYVINGTETGKIEL